jgi:hypothetical protein
MSPFALLSIWAKVKVGLKTIHYFIHIILGRNIDPSLPGLPESSFEETRNQAVGLKRKLGLAYRTAKEKLIH